MLASLSAVVAARVREARARVSLTQASLAEAAGVTDETISRIERGAFEPALSTLVSIADALGVGLDGLTRVDTRGLRPRRRAHGASPLATRLARAAERLDAETLRLLVNLAEKLIVPEAPAARPKRGRTSPAKRLRR
jgi:transcriptional regulator with XRE-family HTH domain